MSLACLMSDSHEELAADFQQFYGLDIGGLGGLFSVRHAAELTAQLPIESRIVRKANPQHTMVEQLLANIEFWTHSQFHWNNVKKPKKNPPEHVFEQIEEKKKKPKARPVSKIEEILARPRKEVHGG